MEETIMQSPRRPLFEKIPLSGPASFTIREFKPAAFKYPWHQHPEVELTWILKGSGLRYVGDSVEPFHAGDFCLLGANLPHTWLSHESTKSVRSFVVQFDPTRWGGLLHLPEFAGVASLFARAARGLRFDATSTLHLRNKLFTQADPLIRFSSLLEILAALSGSQATTLALAPWSRSKRTEADPRLRAVLAYLAGNAGGPVSHAEAARLVRLSPSAFSRFFRRAVGKTFGAYLTDLRLSETCRQLLESDRTISEIAFDAGFGNLSNFNRAFRISRGMAPGKFRRQSVQGAEHRLSA